MGNHKNITTIPTEESGAPHSFLSKGKGNENLVHLIRHNQTPRHASHKFNVLIYVIIVSVRNQNLHVCGIPFLNYLRTRIFRENLTFLKNKTDQEKNENKENEKNKKISPHSDPARVNNWSMKLIRGPNGCSNFRYHQFLFLFELHSCLFLSFVFLFFVL